MNDEDLKGTAAVLRRIADEIEKGGWGSVEVVRDNDLREKPRYSWQPFLGHELVAADIHIRLALPKRSSSPQGGTDR